MQGFRTLALLFVALASTAAADDVVVAVVSDAPVNRLAWQDDILTDELLALTSREFDVRLKRFVASWTKESIEAAAESAYTDPEVDYVLVTGFIANQVLAQRGDYPKPTFLPIIIDTGLLKAPPADGTSGIPNLNYLRTYADFSTDLEQLGRMVEYDTVVLFVDDILSSSIPDLRRRAFEASTARNINLLEVSHDGTDHDLASRIPPAADAVFVAGLPRMPQTAFRDMVDDINELGLPSYSFAGVRDVELGLLMTNSEPRDIARQARLNALNMQAVMLGETAEEQPIDSQIKDRLTINMATARRINLSPNFEVMRDAILLNQAYEIDGQTYGLVDIAELAVRENQDLLAESFAVLAGEFDIATARSNLYPQLGASVSTVTRKRSGAVTSGFFPERTSDAALSLSQVIYSDGLSANLTIQKELQLTREEAYDALRLDIIQAATSAYYRVLNARSQLRVQENNLNITRRNLELAEDRVRLGTSTAADIYRWQSEVAQSQIRVTNGRAALNQAWDTLNRLLHRPPGSRLNLKEAGFDEPFVMTRKDFDDLIRNQSDYQIFSNFYIERALSQSPELAQLDALIRAKQRELKSEKRSFWLPDFSLGAELTENLNQTAGGFATGEGEQDWNVAVRATLPLFSGGERRASVSKADFELRRLQAQRTATAERVEEAIRIQLHAAQAKYVNIDLAVEAAEASRKNFELVSDAYARGTVNVIQLLDAQESALQAAAGAADSLYDFLITIMALQRAVGGYDYLLPADERNALAETFRRALSGNTP